MSSCHAVHLTAWLHKDGDHAELSLLQVLDSNQDQAAPSGQQQQLPSVPVPAQERVQILQKLPADAAPVTKTAADKVQSSADAEVRLGCV